MSNFSENLKELLLEHNLSTRELSRKINSSIGLISTYCLDKYRPTIPNIIKLADYFNCSTDYLLGVVDEDKSKTFNKNVVFDLDVFLKRYNELKSDKSDYAVAKALGINNGVIANLKAGHMPNIDAIISLADLFGTSVDYLIGRSNVR